MMDEIKTTGGPGSVLPDQGVELAVNASLKKEWYEGIGLEDAENFIRSSLRSAARNVIAIGYYLKTIRDRKLFLEAGYENIWDYAHDRYGFSMSTASRYMSRNDKFSKGGNSPILDERYREYGKSQLQEMLSLDEEQLEKVTPGMTARQIRELKKPKETPVPYVEIPGQIELTDFPGITAEVVEQAKEEAAAAIQPKESYTVTVEDLIPEEPIATSQMAGAEPKKEEDTGKCLYRLSFPCTLHEADKHIPGDGQDCTHSCCWNCAKHGSCRLECYSSAQRPDAAEAQQELLSAYGTPKKVYPEGSLIATEGCEGGHDCFSCAMECEIRGEDRYCREAPMGNPFPCEILIWGLQNQRAEVGDQCQFINHDLADHCSGSGEADPCCKNCSGPCEYICARAMRKLDTEPENTQPESQGEMEQKLDESWNIGDLPQASERYLRRLAQVLVSEMGNRMIVPGEIARLSEETVKRKVNILGQETGGEIDIGEGITAYPCEEIIEFYAGEDDLGVCSYGRFATQVRKVMETWSPAGSDPEKDDNVIDAEFEETGLTPEDLDVATFDPLPSDRMQAVKEVLREESEELDSWLEAFAGEPPGSIPKMIERKKIIVAALAAMLSDFEDTELKKQMEAERSEQPELPALKNNEQRKAFIDAYETWPIWIELKETGERYYRYELPDAAMVVKVYYHKCFDYESRAKDLKDRYHDAWEDPEYYLVQDGKHFHDCLRGKGDLIDYLKTMQKKG